MEDNISEEGRDPVNIPPAAKKFCKHCGERIDADCVVCPKCGKQVEMLAGAAPSVIINNTNTNTNANTNTNCAVASDLRIVGQRKSKWTALLLCIFGGWFGLHKFYEGKVGMGILYAFTAGLCGIGVFIDFFSLLFGPDPYYV